MALTVRLGRNAHSNFQAQQDSLLLMVTTYDSGKWPQQSEPTPQLGMDGDQWYVLPVV